MSKKKQAPKQEADEKLYTRLFFAFMDLYKHTSTPLTADFIAGQAEVAFKEIRGYRYISGTFVKA